VTVDRDSTDEGAAVPEMTDKQRRVLDAAMEVFAERGYAGASTAEIAKRAGVAEGTVFKTYKTKKDLLLGIIAPMFARTVAPLLIEDVRKIVAAPHATFEEFLRALYRNRVDFVRSHQRIVRIAMQEVPFHDEVRELAKNTLAASVLPDVLAMIHRFQARGEIRKDADDMSIVRLIVGTFLAYTVASVLVAPTRTWDDDAEVKLMANVLARGLRPL
jgi:AcrR family transcriptional regulator